MGNKAKRRNIRVLLLDDEKEYFDLLQSVLAESQRYIFQCNWVMTYEEGYDALIQKSYDVYFLDYHLGARNGLDLIREVRDWNIHAPIILLTGLGREGLDLEALQDGATYFMDKSELNTGLLERNILYALVHEKDKALLQNSLVDVIRQRVHNDAIGDKRRRV